MNNEQWGVCAALIRADALRMRGGKNKEENECGINTWVSF